MFIHENDIKETEVLHSEIHNVKSIILTSAVRNLPKPRNGKKQALSVVAMSTTVTEIKKIGDSKMIAHSNGREGSRRSLILQRWTKKIHVIIVIDVGTEDGQLDSNLHKLARQNTA